MFRIEPVIRDYDWGSRTALAQMAGREPATRPEAELWVGAHEGDPSYVPALGVTLDQHIAKQPQETLGQSAQDSEARLPFLLKILAAEKALSLQAHPDAHRAAHAPEGVYGDTWPKPEAWLPLEVCEAFIGSLPFSEAAARLRALAVPELEEIVKAADKSENPSLALLSGILQVPQAQQAPLVESVLTALKRRCSQHPDGQEASTLSAWRCILRVHEQFPGDIGVVVLLTMVYRELQPGMSYFLTAGVLHTLVRGAVVEILANSDNVVRAGLTSKKIDVEELLTIVDLAAQVCPEEPVRAGAVRSFRSRTEHFALDEVIPDGDQIPMPRDGQPRVGLVLGGAVTVTCAGESLTMNPLEAIWLPADDEPAVVSGQSGARLFLASPGVSPDSKD